MQLFKNKWFLTALTIIVIGAIGVGVKNGNGDYLKDSHTVTRTDLTREVIVSGSVVPVADATLSFDGAGIVESIVVDVGDVVSEGDVLVTLLNDDIEAELNQVQADLDAERARLAELERGSRPEEISIKQTEVLKAEAALRDTEQSVIDTLDEVLTLTEDAVFNEVDQFYRNPRSGFPTFAKSERGVSDLDETRRDTEDVLEDWDKRVRNGITVSEIDTELTLSRGDVLAVQVLVDDVTEAINRQEPVNAADNATMESAQTNISSALQKITDAEESLTAARTAVTLARDELDLTLAGTTAEEIARQEAIIRSRVATVVNVQSRLEKTLLTAPISGVVTERMIDPGESIAAFETVLRVISNETLELEVDVSELEIAGIQIDNTAEVTLDAYGDAVVFDAHVATIDPAETIIDNVPTYGVTLAFNTPDIRIKSGMTANVRITTDTQTETLALPLRYVEGTTVYVIVDDTLEERTVSFGQADSRGNIAILSGLNEGDIVALPPAQ